MLTNCFSWQDLKTGASHVKQAILNTVGKMDNIWHKIPGYLQTGWEYAKEHIVPQMTNLFHSGVEAITQAISFSGSSRQITKPHSLTFQGSLNSSGEASGSQIPDSPQAIKPPLGEPNELSPSQERALQRRLMIAQSKFERVANKRYDTPAQRELNINRYGTEVFNSLYDTLSQSQPGLNQSVLKDVHQIVNELAAISEETSQKENFAELTEETQNRMIGLIQFTLKHPEPLISSSGQEMAQALGISSKTIDRLRQE